MDTDLWSMSKPLGPLVIFKIVTDFTLPAKNKVTACTLKYSKEDMYKI